MKNIRKIILMLLVVVTFVTSASVINVNAIAAPGSITMKKKSSLYKFTGKNAYFGYEFYVKQLTDGTYAYCVGNNDRWVPAGKTLKSKGAITDKGVDYLLKNGWPNRSFTGDKLKDFHITQAAIWEYYDQTRGTNNWIRKGQSFPANSTGMKAYVYSLVQEAIKAKNTTSVEPSISVKVSNNVMSLNVAKTYFVSDPVSVILTNTKGTYTVELTSAPKGTILKNEKGEVKTTFNDGEKFQIYVPADTIKNGESGTVSFRVKAVGVTYVTYYYSTGNSKYQDIAPVTSYEVTKDLVTAPITFNYSKAKTKVQISKQDITTKKELPGAMLTVKDKDGKVVDQWVSTNEPHYIEGLEPGEYTLGEAIAPEGYILSTETINFTVRDDGSVTSVVMYNSKESVVKISKQDVTTKKELPGATLVIKDKDGNVIDEWVSTDEPYYIEGLKPGEYTLSEKIAPNGYILSEETITFTVKENGDITSVVMYNAPYVEVPKTDLSVSAWTGIIAGILITIGTGLVIYHVKYTK